MRLSRTYARSADERRADVRGEQNFDTTDDQKAGSNI